MQNPLSTSSPDALRSANDRWKSRWSSWLVRSTVFAAAFHAVVFILWPVWEIARLPDRERPIEFIQINPVAAYGGIDDPGEGVIAALPTEEEIVLALEDAGQGLEEQAESETSGVSLPAAAYELVPEIAVSGGPPAASRGGGGLILDRLSAVTPEVAPLMAEVGWPAIRNPTVITRFLSGQFNDMHQTGGATGYVSVAMWIDERGSVEWARVSESSGDQRLDDIALVLFEEVVAFAPARSRGRGVPVQVTISVPFTLPW